MSMILIVDDVAAMRDQYAYDLKRLGGHQILGAAGGAEAVDLLETEPVDCVILDLEMPRVDGFEVLKTIKQKGWRMPVIVYTGTGDFDRCVRAVKLGAYSFISKEEPLERILREVENALAWAELRREVAQLRRRTGTDSPLLGESRAMRALREQIAQLAPIPSAVLIVGESGSGKELVARRLHEESGSDRAGGRARGRAGGPYVALNCAALPESLLESELFGHERGAFTGADRTRRGAFESASGGTLFLDEVGELSPGVQAKLLRVLENGMIKRVGGAAEMKVDVRVVAATNRDLDAEVAAGRFRQDLLFRLNVHVLRVPPLRERLSDIPLLAEHFLAITCEAFGRPAHHLSEAAAARLARYDWQRNNVRELRNVIERMVIAAGAETGGVAGGVADGAASTGPDLGAATTIGPELVPAEIGAVSRPVPATADGSDGSSGETSRGTPSPGTLKDLKAAAERQIILAALEANDWHITRSAAELGLADHSSLLKIMRRHGLKR